MFNAREGRRSVTTRQSHANSMQKQNKPFKYDSKMTSSNQFMNSIKKNNFLGKYLLNYTFRQF